MSAFDGDQFFGAEVRRLVREHKIQTIIETGTKYGETTREFVMMAPRVYSIEADSELFAQVPQWANGLPVEIYHGDSAQVLPHLLKNQFEGQVLFFLDAHGPGRPSPLLAELHAIGNAELKPIIIIHDFQNPERPEYGFDSYKNTGPYTFALIEEELNRIYGAEGYVYQYNQSADGHKRGVIYIGPTLSPIPNEGPTTTVVYVTYKKDLCWIVYSLQLLTKYLKGNYRIVVRAEPDCEEILRTWGVPVTYHYVKPWPDGYAFAMYQKATADLYCESDLVMLLDSDHILTRECSVGDFLHDGNPILRYRRWDEDPNDASLTEGYRQWAAPTERTIGIPLDYDYMLGPPFLFWRDTFQAMRNRVEDVTGFSFNDAVYSATPYNYQNFLRHPKVFCDYEALGLYAAHFEPKRYHLLRSKPSDPNWPFRVYWSHGWNQSIANEVDALLRA